MIVIDRLLEKMVKLKASDLFLSVNNPLAMRIDGEVHFFRECYVTADFLSKICEELRGKCDLKKTDTDFSYQIPSLGIFRVNSFYQNGSISFVLRYIPLSVPNIDTLFLPSQILKNLVLKRRGLILVTGIAGSGKSTTLASMIEYLNNTEHRHVITIEDPIEFHYFPKSCLIQQREIGHDTPDFVTAMKAVVRQSPDIILLGEIRDAETMTTVLQAVETGHLVLSTLHTLNATQTVERILSFFPAEQHGFIRLQMSLLLEAIISQRLIKRGDCQGRVPCVEIMMATPSIKKILEEGATLKLQKAIEESSFFGCMSFDSSLLVLIKQGIISPKNAMEYADNPESLSMKLRGITQKNTQIRAGTMFDTHAEL